MIRLLRGDYPRGWSCTPGMNAAARAAVRLGIAKGRTHAELMVPGRDLPDNQVRELTWDDVEGWAFHGGAELGTRRPVPTVNEY